MKQCGNRKPVLFFLLVLTVFVWEAGAQTDDPFRNPKLSDDARIADLLGRLTLQEKVDLMGGHPKVPRLHLVLSDEAEGLHGLALGGPGGWGPRGHQPLPTTTFPQEKGLGETWDPTLMKKIGALEGEEARYYYQNPVTDFGGIVVRAPNTDLSRDPRWAALRSRWAKTRTSSAPWRLHSFVECRAPIPITGRQLR
jgi:beta-glucosidase